MTVTSRYPFGTNVFTRDWDVLILLDTCRVDALREVADEYEFLRDSEIGSIWSTGSASNEWLANTFREEFAEQISDTAYITANGFSQRVLIDREFPDDGNRLSWSNWKTVSADQLGLLDRVWSYTPDHSQWHTEPQHVTDRMIAEGREGDYDRLIAHYSQPHHPYAANAWAEGREELHPHELEPFEELRADADFDKVWSAYTDHLRAVLDDLEVLLANLDAEKVVISADHGECFGELGFLYNHRPGVVHPSLRKVPWVVTSATDSGEYEPQLEPENLRDNATEKAIERLEKLGYVDP